MMKEMDHFSLHQAYIIGVTDYRKCMLLLFSYILLWKKSRNNLINE